MLFRSVEAERLLLDKEGRLGDGGGRIGLTFTGSAIDRLDALMAEDAAAPLFIGSALAKGSQWRVGDWCDVLAWSPWPEG